jgi:hypothetical protein
MAVVKSHYAQNPTTSVTAWLRKLTASLHADQRSLRYGAGSDGGCRAPRRKASVLKDQQTTAASLPLGCVLFYRWRRFIAGIHSDRATADIFFVKDNGLISPAAKRGRVRHVSFRME